MSLFSNQRRIDKYSFRLHLLHIFKLFYNDINMQGRINRKRKLSPSGSKARIVEAEDGIRYGEITDELGNRSRLSLGAMKLLQVFIYLFAYLLKGKSFN